MNETSVAREILRGCVCSRTRMLDRVLTRLFDESLAPLGLRANQLTVLSLLASMEELRAVDVGRFLELDKATVSRGLALLLERGWVEERERASGRGRTLALTEEGRGLLLQALPLWRSAQREALATLGGESVETLRTAADSFLRLRAQA